MAMRIKSAIIGALSLFVSAGAVHAGDPAAGEAEWRQCRSCHMITSDAGDLIQRGGRVGPNLYAIIGRPAGTVGGFRYSADLVAAGQNGLVWTQENFVGYIEDPSGFLSSYLGRNVRSPMNYQMRSGAADMFAYLESIGQ
jgi:cytochrome c